MKLAGIWYSRNHFFRDAIMGYDWLKTKGISITLDNINVTHALVAEVFTDEGIMGALWAKYQAENGFRLPSTVPVGREPNEVGHTSMSEGDIILLGDERFECDSIGWKKLPGLRADSDPA